jgi:hypothetical protein
MLLNLKISGLLEIDVTDCLLESNSLLLFLSLTFDLHLQFRLEYPQHIINNQQPYPRTNFILLRGLQGSEI